MSAPTPERFGGEVTHFQSWFLSVKALLSRVASVEEKVLLLLEHTKGEVQDIVERFAYPPHEERLQVALDALEAKYGSDELMFEARFRQIENFPPIAPGDGKALQKYSSLLHKILSLHEGSTMTVLSCNFIQKKLLGKLPDNIQTKWISGLVTGKKEGETLKDLIKFIDIEEKILNHHMRTPQARGTCLVSRQGNETLPPPLPPLVPSAPPMPHSQTENKDLKQRDVICTFCKSTQHQIAQCPQYTELSLEDKRSAILSKGLCFNCLHAGHVAKDCQSRFNCQVCKGRHHTSLHRYHVTLAGVCSTPEPSSSTSILPVIIKHQGTGRSVTVYALLDSMSNTSFVSSEVVRTLGITGNMSELTLDTMNGIASQSSMVIQGLSVQGLEEETVIQVPTCHVRDKIPCDPMAIPQQGFVSLFPHLAAVKVPPLLTGAPIGLLLGYHVSSAFCPLQIACKDIESPFGIRTPLGWCVMGGIRNINTIPTSHSCLNSVEVPALPEFCLDPLYHPPLPSILHNYLPGMAEDSRGSYSQDDLRFLEIMERHMQPMHDGHMSAPLPLRPKSVLPSNLFVARSRLNSLKKKLQGQPDLRESYVVAMEEMITLGFAERCPKTQIPGRVWYIPHHAVVTDKTRIVFDCSVKVGKVSLNECLLQGPDLLNSLLGILLRFRSNSVALSCDIKKMFHQFHVDEHDRDFLRFLWWEDGKMESEPLHFRMTVHLFGATSSPGVATFGLRKIAADFGPAISCSATHFIEHNFYVDDGLLAVSSAEEAIEIFQGTKEILKKGGLTCHKLKSSSVDVLTFFSEEERAAVASIETKTLGIPWNTTSDELTVQFVINVEKITRRSLLSVLAKTYDPLGFMAPISLYGKSILQDMTRQKVSWDESPPSALQKKFQHLKGMATCHTPVRVLRPLFTVANSMLKEIHIFCDASQTGYAAVAYARYQSPDGKFVSSFLLGKSRVAPLKPTLTIPRLELVAAVLATSLSLVIRKEMNLQDCPLFFWTDSLVVLGYLHNENARYKMFVANRVSFIVSNTPPLSWHHIRGVDNPADFGSRGIWSDIWITGPPFLTQENPVNSDMNEDIPSPNPEDLDVICLNTLEITSEITTYVSHTWMRTLRLWAWLRRWRCREPRQETGTLREISLVEIEEAKGKILLRVQQTHFASEISALKEGKLVSKGSRLSRLDPFIDERGILRVGGRLRQAQLDQQVSFPIILPGNSDIDTLVIQHFHNLTHHQGRGLTIAEIRRGGFWILGLSYKVKRVIHACVICSKLRGSPVEQRMADLPEERLTPTPPFTNCGCDTFGPFEVKQGRSRVKRWVLIVTCMYSRAVHLESLHSLSSDSFCQAFKRLTSLRGDVRLLVCDQGTNFVGAKHFLTNSGCEVRFNPPSASHRGGFYERLIGTSRRILEGILVQHAGNLNDESFTTLLAETAWIANCRPLSVENLNDPTSLAPLTANMLLTQKHGLATSTDERAIREDLYARVQWKRVKYLAQLFASRWQGEILLLLQERQKWERPRSNIKPGDVVIMVDEQQHRSYWKMARVTEVKTSTDGLVRSCSVVTADRSKYERPVQKLVHLLSPK